MKSLNSVWHRHNEISYSRPHETKKSAEGTNNKLSKSDESIKVTTSLPIDE